MSKTVIIYGKDSWPYTTRAREDYAADGYQVDYRDVTRSSGIMNEMIKISKGRRDVPLIKDGAKVTIGYGGAWAV